MANNNDFSILLKTMLDKSGINSDLKQIQSIVNKYTVNIIPELKAASLKNQLKFISKDLANDFNKTFGTNLTGNDFVKAYENQAKEIIRENQLVEKSFTEMRKNAYQSIGKRNPVFDDMAEYYRQTEAAIQKTKGLADNIKINIETEKYSTQIAQLNDSLKKYSSVNKDVFNNAQDSLNNVSLAYEKMIHATSDDERVAAEKTYHTALDKTKNLITQVKLQYDKSNDIISVGDQKRINMINTLNNYLQKNTAITKESKQIILGWIKNFETTQNLTTGAFNKINSDFQTLDANMRASGKLGLSWGDKIKQTWEKFGGWSFATGSFMALLNQLRKIPQEVYKIDTSMTNLYKVTDETSSTYNNFLSSATKSAQELGQSISNLIDQTATWAKLGFNIDEASELAKISSVYVNVGEVDGETAVSDLVTAMKSFNIEASDSITIVDALNKLGNEFATDAASLGTGLTKSASALHLAGNDINETLAMLTGGTEITQNASEMGNSLKVLSMRLRGMKGELESLGEEYENVESISKIQTQILNQTNGAVNIFDDAGNFRSTYKILEDIAKVWDHISQVDQAALLEIIAGKQRGNQVSALIQSFQSGQVQKAYEASLNSAGSAMQEQERWLESLEAKIQQFQTAFQSLSQTTLDSNFLKGIVDAGTNTINILDSVIDRVDILPTLATGLSAVFSLKNFGRDKMFFLNNIKYAECNKCSLGY